MEEYIQYFETMPSWQKLVWIFICLSFNWILEALRPLISNDYGKLRHIGINMIFLASDLLINLLVGLVTVGVYFWISQNGFGVLNLIELPFWTELLIAVLALDFFAQYGMHYLLHQVPFLWKFHMVHHSDTHVDATTGTRHHPIDYLMREVGSLVAVALFGIPLAFYVLYRVITIFFAYITHANITVPMWLDRPLSFLFVTPNMHKFHHHYEAPWTDTNYGNIFSIWDRLLGTLVYDDPKKVTYGLDIMDDSRDEDVMYQLTAPFDRDIRSKDPRRSNLTE